MARRRSSPKAVDLAAFEDVVRLVARMIEQHAIWVKLTAWRIVEFVVEREPFDALVAASGIPRDTVQQVLDGGLADMLGMALVGEAEFYGAKAAGGGSGESDKVKAEEAMERMKVVEECLLSDHLKKRYKVKMNLVRDMFCDCEWQVQQSMASSRAAGFDNRVALVSLRFLTQRRPLSRNEGLVPLLSSLMGSTLQDAGTSFDLDVDDLDYLIALLRHARAALDAAAYEGVSQP